MLAFALVQRTFREEFFSIDKTKDYLKVHSKWQSKSDCAHESIIEPSLDDNREQFLQGLGIVDARKRHVRHRLVQEVAQRSPAVCELVLKQAALGRNTSDKCIVVAICSPSLLPHFCLAVRLHPGCRPATVAPSYGAEKPRVQLRDKADHQAPLRRDHVGVKAPIPRLDLTLDQDHLRFGIRRDQIFGEGDRGRVSAHGAVASQQLVPLGARKASALAQVFGVHCLVPQVAVADVGKEDGRMVAIVAQDVQGCLNCWAPNGSLRLVIVGMTLT